MNRQLIIRGAAISVTAITASVFLAGQFLGDGTSLSASGSVEDVPIEVRGASVIAPFGRTELPADMAPKLEFSALSTPQPEMAAADAQQDFQPQLAFSEQPNPVETSLCDATLTAQPGIDGLVEMRLSAPCNPSERVVISHGDLAFTATLDQAGGYSVYLPALSETVSVDVFLEDDTLLSAQTNVVDFDQYARMIVQWTGADAVALHAYHRGAQHGEDGHIHAMNPFDPSLEEAFLVALGDPAAFEPMLAQVYSVALAQASDTRLQLELAVTEQTCGSDMIAYVMPTQGEMAGQPQELQVAMPECGSGDGYVILDLPFRSAPVVQAALNLTVDDL